jgi:hypothetical protein
MTMAAHVESEQLSIASLTATQFGSVVHCMVCAQQLASMQVAHAGEA